jgi:branched-chain amino acid transport system ATP-binding protein
VAEGGLRLEGVAAGYGRTVVIEDIDLKVAPGECIAVIGRTGVGKTTLVATLMGHTDLHRGAIVYRGRALSAAPIEARVEAGFGYVPQEREVFPSLTVEENLEVARRSPGGWTLERVFRLFPNLGARRANRGNQLSGGEQQMLAIGRALMGNPSLLLMDEPSEGLAPVIVEELQRALATLRDAEGLSIVLVEQNTRVALAFARRAVVMDRGRIVYDGESAALAADRARLAALMGLEIGRVPGRP